MNRVDTLKLAYDNPQKLLDDGVELEFDNIPGKAKMVDSWMAATEYHVFEFVSGPYAGKKLFCDVDYGKDTVVGWQYNTNVNSDGFLFNWNPNEDVSNIGDGEVTGGDHVPELDGVAFTIKEDSN